MKKFWKILGPGLSTGAADDDPSGIATYSQLGASKGFGFAWLSLFTYPLMSVVQEMCARIGLVTGSGLASNIKRYYPRSLLYLTSFLLVFANTLNIGADLGAMAEATKLVMPALPFTALVFLFAIISLLLQIFVSYKKYAKYLKYLTLSLFSYVIVAFFVDIDWALVLRHVIMPSFSFDKSDILIICAALGTTISPYLFFWQTSQEVEEQILKGESTEELRRESITKDAVSDMRVDVWSGMFFSNIVMFFIIVVCGATLYKHGITNINTAADAAKALEPIAGSFAFWLFALGIIGTGFLAIPVLAGSASYALTETFGYKPGLNRKLSGAHFFYGIIALAMALGIGLNLMGFDPIRMLIYAAIMNGIVSPIMIFFVVRISGSGQIMGEYKNKSLTNVVGWLTMILMFVVAFASLAFLIE